MAIRERAVDTPTVSQLKRDLTRRTKGHKVRHYRFYLTEKEVMRLSDAKVRPGAILAYALIRSAVRAAPREPWVSLRRPVRDAVGRDYRWWHTVTLQLEAAGFIVCERQRGRLPRYQLVKRRKAAPAKCT